MPPLRGRTKNQDPRFKQKANPKTKQALDLIIIF
jgi:hypothetical protein